MKNDKPMDHTGTDKVSARRHPNQQPAEKHQMDAHRWQTIQL